MSNEHLFIDARRVRSSEERQLRSRLTNLSQVLRTSDKSEKPALPRYVEIDQIREPGGRVVWRKKVIMMTGGCSVPTCTMCPFTNENNFGHGRDYPELVEQARSALSRSEGEPPYETVALYNDGSFFAPSEISEDAQIEIARLVKESGVRRLTVESLPDFISEHRLKRFVEALDGVELEVGIGLQSSNDLVRETLVNTRITRRAFEDALATMQRYGVLPKVYLMVKPPFLTDGEALTDVVASAEYVGELGVEGITLCPTRVSKNTVAWELWKNGDYVPPSLWTLLDAIRRTSDRSKVRIATMNLEEVDFPSLRSEGCEKCTDRLIEGIRAFSVNGDRSVLDESCECQELVEPAELDATAIIRRASTQLASTM